MQISLFLDVQTQAMYQMMDETFVGLIFSCFNQSKSSSVSTNYYSLHLHKHDC